MKKFLLLLFVLVSIAELQAQKLPPVDASPADYAWLPPNRKDPVARIIYGRPSKKGRTMLGGVEAYGKVWRLGANEATEVKFLKDVTLGDKTVKAGTYTMYAIPGETEWTIIVNSKLDTWGAYSYDEKLDVARVAAPVAKPEKEVESFTIAFDEPKDNASTMYIAWENTLVKLPIKY